MPQIITIDELAEELADEWGVYPTEDNPDKRSLFVGELSDRIRQASNNDQMLQTYRYASVCCPNTPKPNEPDKPDKSIEPPELTYVNENYYPSPFLTRLGGWIKTVFEVLFKRREKS